MPPGSHARWGRSYPASVACRTIGRYLRLRQWVIAPGSCDHPGVTDPPETPSGTPREPTVPPRRLSWALASSLTFIAAGSVLVLEIAAGRLLAPYVGVSLTTYTGIIGAILAGIALGAWLGGRAADALGAERLIGPTVASGGLAAIAAVPIVALVGA